MCQLNVLTLEMDSRAQASKLGALARGCTYRLAQRPALTHGDLVTFLDTESGRDMCREVLVSLLVTRVFGDEMEVFTTDDEGSVHFGGDDRSSQDPSADRDEAGEGALLVCTTLGQSSPFQQLVLYLYRHPWRLHVSQRIHNSA